MNPIMEQLNKMSGQNGIFNLINSVRNAKDPSSMMNYLTHTNPQVQSVMNYVNQNGGDAKQAFFNLAQQRGVNPQTILSQLNI